LNRLIEYLIRRLIFAAPTLLILSLIIFSTMTFVPLDERVRLYKSEFKYRNPLHEVSDEVIIAKYHLNDSFIVQWATWFKEDLKGNLGFSRVMGVPVLEGMLLSFGATLEIVMYSAPLIVLIGYKVGVLSAKRAYKKTWGGDPVDKIVRVASTIAYSTPAFLLGLFLLLVFYLGLHWPSIRRLGLEAEFFVRSSCFTRYTGLYTVDALLNGQPWILFDALQHLALPVLTLTITISPIIIRITRASMMEELNKPYVLLGRAKGLNEKQVVDHAKKPASFSIFTVSSIIVASMLTGVVVVEWIFQIHGLGYWLVKGATRWDYQLIVGITLLFCLIYMIANIMVDIMYTYLDPRVNL